MQLINEDGQLNPQLVELANRYGVAVSTRTPFQEANVLFQDKWRQKHLLHAYQITGNPATGEDLASLEALGNITAINPPTKEEDAAWGPMEFQQIKMQKGYLLMGALKSAVVKRLQFPIDHFPLHPDQQPQFAVPNLFYLLGGARKLDRAKETSAAETEAGMMQEVWNQLSHPAAWVSKLVDTPMQPKDPAHPEGEQRPPNSADTVSHWLLTELCPGYFLVGSNQPYIQYQLLVAERVHEALLDQRRINFSCYFKGCGPAATPTLPLATHLDTLAKQFHEETLCQSWWKGIVKEWNDDGIRMRCGTIVARGRTSWGARGTMNEQLREAENLYVALNLTGPFSTKAEAEAASV